MGTERGNVWVPLSIFKLSSILSYPYYEESCINHIDTSSFGVYANYPGDNKPTQSLKVSMVALGTRASSKVRLLAPGGHILVALQVPQYMEREEHKKGIL